MPPFTCCETLLINHLRRFLFGFFRSLAFRSFFINLLVHHVDLALPFRWHSSFEGRMTFFATSQIGRAHV